jgi:hypothetical protein
MATDESPCLDGQPGNDLRLKKDLGDMGVFDPCMPLYMLYRARSFESMGFTGFEGRHYSLFESLNRDMARATNLQMLITSLAYKYIVTGSVTHADIPDHPFVESERRQIFFGAAAGIPTFYVRKDTPNRLLARMVKETANTRSSRRYSGYTRVQVADFRCMLVKRLRADAPELIEMAGMASAMEDLDARIICKDQDTVAARLSRRICDSAGASSPMALDGNTFNSAAETFYRTQLKKEQMGEAIDLWCDALHHLDGMSAWRDGTYNQALLSILKGKDAAGLIRTLKSAIAAEDLPLATVTRLIHLMLLTLDHMRRQTHADPSEQ